MNQGSTHQPTDRPFHFSLKNALFLLMFLLLLYVVLPQLKEFHSSISTIRHADPSYLILALIIFFSTYTMSAASYVILAKKKLHFGRTVIIQLVSMFVNRLLPAGLGAIGLSYKYLRKNKHTIPEASSVVAVNNIMGVVSHLLLLGLTLLLLPIPTRDFHLPYIKTVYYIEFGALLALIIFIIIFSRKVENAVFKNIKGVVKNILSYRHTPKKLIGSGLSIMALTILYTFCLMACAYSLGFHASFSVLLVVLTLGVIGGTAAPTPGGLGGSEAGLFGGLLLFGASKSTSLAVTLLYRLITYWLGLLVGVITFFIAERRAYF